jgi:hypothetical protein
MPLGGLFFYVIFYGVAPMKGTVHADGQLQLKPSAPPPRLLPVRQSVSIVRRSKRNACANLGSVLACGKGAELTAGAIIR